MNMKKISSLLLALVLVLAMAVPAMAATVTTGSITIANASKGENYSVYKLFDASVTGKEDGSIVYTGDIPASLSDYFENVNGYVVAKAAAKTSDGSLTEAAITALTAWANTQTATVGPKTADGGALIFDNLEFGYYVVTTSQGGAISVDSTNPNATIYDKNSKEPSIVKKVDDADVDIGQTVTYTATSTTSNYLGAGKDAEIVTKYVISDTLPDFLSDVKVTGIVIDKDGKTETTEDQESLTVEQFGDDKAIEIEWATYDEDTKTYTSKYPNGSLIIVTYTAKVTDKAVIDGTAGNKNEVTLTAYTDKVPGDEVPPKPWDKTWKDDEVIFTYAAALEKVDEDKKPLAGAKFAVNGLEVKGSNGKYVVVSYDATSTTLGTEMETDENGKLIIAGLNSGAVLVVTETEAPAGYNKLTGTIELKPVKTGYESKATVTTIYYDVDGNVTETVTEKTGTSVTFDVNPNPTAVTVENKKGTELPETGGMGTTILYVAGGILVLGAVIVLITKKRMAASK